MHCQDDMRELLFYAFNWWSYIWTLLPQWTILIEACRHGTALRKRLCFVRVQQHSHLHTDIYNLISALMLCCVFSILLLNVSVSFLMYPWCDFFYCIELHMCIIVWMHCKFNSCDCLYSTDNYIFYLNGRKNVAYIVLFFLCWLFGVSFWFGFFSCNAQLSYWSCQLRMKRLWTDIDILLLRWLLNTFLANLNYDHDVYILRNPLVLLNRHL